MGMSPESHGPGCLQILRLQVDPQPMGPLTTQPVSGRCAPTGSGSAISVARGAPGSVIMSPQSSSGRNLMADSMSIAVLGASGYIGRRLVEQLTLRGHRLTAVGRVIERLPSGPGVSQRAVDLGDTEATAAVLSDIDSAYYLVHAMAGGGGYADRDRATARSFAQAAQRVGLERIIYLGGLGGEGLSEHLSSRQEVGRILRESGIPVVELRAAVILGAGSISFEMLRYLTERLPAMVCPKWVDTRLQPLAERDLLTYLEQALDVPDGIYEIGAPDTTTYHDMMQCYADVRGLSRRAIVKIPFLTPSLSARWVDFVTPVDRAVSHALIESLTNEVVVRDRTRTADTFDIEPMPVRRAIRVALTDQATRMPDCMFDLEEGLTDGIYVMRCEACVPPEQIPALRTDLTRCGGDLGWYGARWLWHVRLFLGRLLGENLSLRRPDHSQVGADADWWKIERSDPDRLVLVTTQWFFGDAWLGYWVVPDACALRPGRIVQVAAFRPKGVVGFTYWRLLWPVHRQVFRAMVRHRVRRASTR